jgi:ferritin-like protein
MLSVPYLGSKVRNYTIIKNITKTICKKKRSEQFKETAVLDMINHFKKVVVRMRDLKSLRHYKGDRK